MKMGKYQRAAYVLVVSGLMLALRQGISFASCAQGAQTCSTNYAAGETFFGNGGQLNACSTNYCSKQSAGETTVGNPSSPSYQAHAGFNTDRTPYLQLQVNSTSINLGLLSSSSTSTATATFSVKAYLASGYNVVNASPPPTNGSYTIHSLTSPTAASAGSEQFGMNLVNNTTVCGAPVNFGADPVQVPSSSFSFGAAASGYNTCGKFQYNQGDTIANSPSSSGETDYTISYIFNISNLTPGGTFSMNHVLVATATF